MPETLARPCPGSFTSPVLAGARHNAPVPNPRLGYLLVALSAACSALNGSLARYLLDDGMSAVRLSQLRSAVSFALLALGLALLSRGRLKIAKADVPKLAWLGVAGIALVHASYFAAIARIDIGVALALEPAQPRLGARRVGDRQRSSRSC